MLLSAAEIVCNSPASMSIRTFLSLFAGENLEADSIQLVSIDNAAVSGSTNQNDVNVRNWNIIHEGMVGWGSSFASLEVKE